MNKKTISDIIYEISTHADLNPLSREFANVVAGEIVAYLRKIDKRW